MRACVRACVCACVRVCVCVRARVYTTTFTREMTATTRFSLLVTCIFCATFLFDIFHADSIGAAAPRVQTCEAARRHENVKIPKEMLHGNSNEEKRVVAVVSGGRGDGGS